MLTLPADKTSIMRNYLAEYSKPERQFTNFPFDPALREYLQALYRENFYVDSTRGSGEEEKLVRVRKLLAFEKKSIESIELYMVGVYFQGDLSVSTLTAIPEEVFTRLKFMHGRPADFYTQTAKYILSLTTWCHLIIENCPVNLGFIKSTDFCSKMVSSLKSELSFAGKKQTGRKCSLRGCITIKNNYSFGEHEYGIMAGRSVFVEIPKAQYLSDAGIKEWKVNLAHAKEEKDRIAAAAASAAAATVVIGTSSTGPLADNVVTAAGTKVPITTASASSVITTEASTIVAVVTTGTSLLLVPDESSVTVTAAADEVPVVSSDVPASGGLAPDESSVTAVADVTETDDITGDVEIAAALQKIYNDNESFKINIPKKRREYRLECERSQKFKELGSRVSKNEIKLRTTRTFIFDMIEFSKSKIMPKGSQSHTDFNQTKNSLETLIEEIEEDNLSIAEEKSTFLDNTFHEKGLVPAIVFTDTKTNDKKKLREHRAKTLANHEINLQGNESIAFNGLNALVYNLQDSFILCLRSAYSGGKIDYDKITETYGKLSTFINNWLFLLKPSQQKNILNLFIVEGVNKNICDDCNEILLLLTTKTLLDMNEYVGAEDKNQFKLELVLIREANKHAFSITNKGETGTTTTKVTQANT
jgi:hypothetical protein